MDKRASSGQAELRPAGKIDTLINSISSAVDDLSKEVYVLADKIDKVMSPQEPQKCSPGDGRCVDTKVQSPMGDKLREIEQKILNLKDSVIRYQERVDL